MFRCAACLAQLCCAAGGVAVAVELFFRCLYDCRVAMAQPADTNARNEVEVTLAVFIKKVTAFCLFDFEHERQITGLGDMTEE